MRWWRRPSSRREPALGDEVRAAALGFGLEDELELALGADEQDALALEHDATQQLLRGLELAECFLEIDDVDAATLGKDEAAHLGVPAARLVAEVYPGLEQIL